MNLSTPTLLGDYVFETESGDTNTSAQEGIKKWSCGVSSGTVKTGYITDVSDADVLFHHLKGIEFTKQVYEQKEVLDVQYINSPILQEVLGIPVTSERSCETQLIDAVQRNQIESVESLLEMKAQVDGNNRRGFLNPIQIAARYADVSPEILTLLIQYNANVNCGPVGNYPLDLAIAGEKMQSLFRQDILSNPSKKTYSSREHLLEYLEKSIEIQKTKIILLVKAGALHSECSSLYGYTEQNVAGVGSSLTNIQVDE
jgi:hypothetical protein